MNVTWIIRCCAAILLTTGVNGDDAALVATFSSNGVDGEVEFFEDKGTTMARVIIHKPETQKFTWKVHQFPPNVGDEDPCNKEQLGDVFVDLAKFQKTLQTGKTGIVPLPGVKLSEDGGIMGRTLVLKGTTFPVRVCAVIRPSTPTKTFVAKFHSPIGGAVVVRQSSFGASITSRLYHTDGTRSSATHTWSIVEFSRSDDEELNFRKEKTRCEVLKKSTRNLAKLSEFLGELSVGDVTTSRTHIVDPLLDPLEDKSGSLYVIVYSVVDPSSILACAIIRPIKKMVVQANFDKGVSGYVHLEQDSPFDPTVVTLGLDDLDQNVVHYGIDDLPAFRSSKGSCATLRRRAFNPYNVDADDVKSTKQGTHDQYPVGDLSRKHGTLQNRHDVNKLYIDNNLPLFGPMSVNGRAVTLYDHKGRPIACSNLDYKDEDMLTAVASFNGGPLKGQMIFRQPMDDPKTDTIIYVILYRADKRANMTSNHGFHIHDGNVKADVGKSTTKCSRVGPMMNPYDVSSDGMYKCHCSGISPMKCQIGDVSGKVGYLQLTGVSKAGDPTQPGRYVFMDPTLPLSGPNSIIDKTVVIGSRDYSDDPMVCTNVMKIPESTYKESTKNT